MNYIQTLSVKSVVTQLQRIAKVTGNPVYPLYVYAKAE